MSSEAVKDYHGQITSAIDRFQEALREVDIKVEWGRAHGDSHVWYWPEKVSGPIIGDAHRARISQACREVEKASAHINDLEFSVKEGLTHNLWSPSHVRGVAKLLGIVEFRRIGNVGNMYETIYK